MSPYLPKAVIATEDRRFYSHFGIDPIGLVRAAFANLAARHLVQGGSTITQQLAKNLFLTPERSFCRKIQETLLALWLEHRFTKDQILEIYLNRVYLGAGTYGVDAAAHRYFDKSARQTTLYESAAIAGLLKAPTRFNPTRDRDKAAARTAQVLANMVDAGFVTGSQAMAAISGGTLLAAVAVTRPGARYFADWVAEQLGDFAGTGNRDLPWSRRSTRACRQRPKRRSPTHHPRGRQNGGQPGRARGDVAGRRGPRHGRRPRLQPEPVQSRDPGAAAAGLRLQAVRLSGRARGRLAALRPLRRRADPHRQLAAARLYRALSGRDDPGRRVGPVDQHDRRPGRAARRPPQCRGGRPPARHFVTAHARGEPRARHQRGQSVRARLGLCALRQWRIGVWPHGITEIRDSAGRSCSAAPARGSGGRQPRK